MRKNNYPLELIDTIRGHTTINREKLLWLLKVYFPDASDTSLKWKLQYLIKLGIIRVVSRGVYSPVPKIQFEPTISEYALEIISELKNNSPTISYTLTETGWLHPLMVKSPTTISYIIFEVDKYTSLESFDYAREMGYIVVQEPTASEFKRFLKPYSNVVIVRTLPSEAPYDIVKGIPISSIEKIIVDLMATSSVYENLLPYAEEITRTAFEKYAINVSRLRRYASRRNLSIKIFDLLTSVGAIDEPPFDKRAYDFED